MAKKEEKSKAELYREERKARIAKANKKNSKKGSSSGGSIVKRIVAVVLCAAVVLGGLYFILDATGVVNRMIPALKVGNKSISSATYYYYYLMSYNQAQQVQEQYGQYMSYYDTSKAPDEQDYMSPDEDGNTITWAEQFMKQASQLAQSNIAFYNEAVKAGITLTDEEKEEIEHTINDYKENAASSGYSLDAYLRRYFGFGLKEFKKQVEQELYANKYKTQKQDEFKDGITEEQLKKELEDNPTTYGLATVRYYNITLNEVTQKEGESDEDFAARKDKENEPLVKAAEGIIDGVKSEDSFIDAVNKYADEKAAEEKAKKAEEAKDDAKAEEAEKAEETKEEKKDDEKKEEKRDDTTLLNHSTYSSISSAIGKDGADWAFDSARKKGETKVITGDDKITVVYIVKPRSLDAHSVTVHYCLIPYNDSMQAAADDDERTEAKDKAEKLYDEWKKSGDTSEDSFSELCKENSADTSTSEKGGLIDVRLNTMVSAFEEWCFDKSRKAGDTGVIEATEYGYFLIYFVSDNKDDLDWKDSATSTVAETLYTDFSKDVLADTGSYKVVDHTWAENRISKKFCKMIKRNAALSSK